jgi:hypothetical protein
LGARKFLVIVMSHLLIFDVYQRWEETMKLKTFGYAAVIAVAAVALTIGSATTSEAKGKKKAAAAPAPVMATCWTTPAAPVCGARGKMKFTYINSCYAAKDGAKVVSQNACATKAAKKGKKKMAKKSSKKKM